MLVSGMSEQERPFRGASESFQIFKLKRFPDSGINFHYLRSVSSGILKFGERVASNATRGKREARSERRSELFYLIIRTDQRVSLDPHE